MTEKYDVIIIGAGIGGLVCGCYLAKSKMNILLVEQSQNPGGYCTSFLRNGFRFDTGVHYFGGVKKGQFGKVLEELDIKDELELSQFDPVDKIIMPENVNYIRADIKDTIRDFQKSFPKEENNIKSFFAFILENNYFNLYMKTKELSFREFLDNFFQDYKIKATLELLLSNVGISAKEMSALSAVVLYRDYILDGGYYPVKGMQSFPDILAKKFKEYGGQLITGTKVKEILIKNGAVCGIILDNGERFNVKYVVSNADATQTFKELINNADSRECKIVEKMVVSPSLFVVYMGIDKELECFTTDRCNTWTFSNYKINEYYSNLKKNVLASDIPFLMISFPSSHSPELRNSIDKGTVQLFSIAPFKSNEFWDSYRDILADKLVKKAVNVLPGIEKHIKIRLTATPQTFYRYTLNQKGSAFGWLSTVKQSRSMLLPQKTSIKNMFIAGHWCTIGTGQGGVPKSAYSGKRAAELILSAPK